MTNYLQNHARAFFSSLGRLLSTPFTSIMTVLVLAITIALAASFFLLVNNARQLSSGLEASNQMTVFLKQSLTESSGKKLAQRLKNKPSIDHVNYISKSQALQEFKVHSGFGDALNALDQNPLPAVIQVLPKNALHDEIALTQLLKELESLQQVDFVQMDMQWVQRLQSMLDFAERAVSILNILLGCAVIFITANTIRLELQNRREEVLISKLVGATHAFVQRPFLYTGFWLGLIAGISAWLIVSSMVIVLQSPMAKIAELYNNQFQLINFNFTQSLVIIVGSASLGAIGALLVLHHQLRQIKPQ